MATPHCLTEICEKLDNWIDSHFTDDERCNDSEGAIPLASFSFAPNGADCVMIGDVVVWDSESSPSEPGISFETCRDEYLRIINNASPFLREAKRLCNPKVREQDSTAANTEGFIEQLNIRIDELEKELEAEKERALGIHNQWDRAKESYKHLDEMFRGQSKQWVDTIRLCRNNRAQLDVQILRNEQLKMRIMQLETGQAEVNAMLDLQQHKVLERDYTRAAESIMPDQWSAADVNKPLDVVSDKCRVEKPHIPDIDIAEPPRREGSGPLYKNEGGWGSEQVKAPAPEDVVTSDTTGPKYKVNDRVRFASTLNYRGRITAHHQRDNGNHTYYVKWDSNSYSPALFERDLIPDYLDIGDKVVVHAPHMANHGKTGTVRHYHASVMGLEMDDGSRTTYHSDWLKRVDE